MYAQIELKLLNSKRRSYNLLFDDQKEESGEVVLNLTDKMNYKDNNDLIKFQIKSVVRGFHLSVRTKLERTNELMTNFEILASHIASAVKI